jgi:aldose 1-epimerase
MIPLLTLSAGEALLRLAPSIGGSIADWWRGDTPLMRPLEPGALEGRDARGMASYPLVPVSNRIARNRFSFAGLTHHLPALLNGQSIHGAGWQLPWTVTDSSASAATLTLRYLGGPLWPFAFQSTQRFDLTPDALACTIAIRNDAEHPAPLAFGLHPFFPRTPQIRLYFAARHVWLHDDSDKIPRERVEVPPEWDHRHGLAVGAVTLDHCFAGWNGLGRIVYPEHDLAIAIAADPAFGHLIVFVPAGRDFFAFEPVSNMTDGINRIDGVTEHGMFVLRPGEERTATTRFTLETL